MSELGKPVKEEKQMENRCEGCRWFRKNDAPASDWCNYNPEIVYKGESSYACSKFEPKESPASNIKLVYCSKCSCPIEVTGDFAGSMICESCLNPKSTPRPSLPEKWDTKYASGFDDVWKRLNQLIIKTIFEDTMMKEMMRQLLAPNPLLKLIKNDFKDTRSPIKKRIDRIRYKIKGWFYDFRISLCRFIMWDKYFGEEE